MQTVVIKFISNMEDEVKKEISVNEENNIVYSLIHIERLEDIQRGLNMAQEGLKNLIDDAKSFGKAYPRDMIFDMLKKCDSEGRVPFMTVDGIYSSEYENFLSQGIEGVLYDLNRDMATLYATYSERTINDLSLVYLLKRLISEREEMKKEIETLKSQNKTE